MRLSLFLALLGVSLCSLLALATEDLSRFEVKLTRDNGQGPVSYHSALEGNTVVVSAYDDASATFTFRQAFKIERRAEDTTIIEVVAYDVEEDAEGNLTFTIADVEKLTTNVAEEITASTGNYHLTLLADWNGLPAGNTNQPSAYKCCIMCNGERVCGIGGCEHSWLCDGQRVRCCTNDPECPDCGTMQPDASPTATVAQFPGGGGGD